MLPKHPYGIDFSAPSRSRRVPNPICRRSSMKSRWLIPIVAFAAGVTWSACNLRSAEVNANSRSIVIDRDSIAYGRTYSEWSAAWEQWVYSIPASRHPLFDNGDCGTEQSGPVWFLGGSSVRTVKFAPTRTSCGVVLSRLISLSIFRSLTTRTRHWKSV
jgi:hypothetical protein